MLTNLAAPLGAAAGGALGQMGDLLSAPRRGLMQLLGMPETGSDLLSQTFGMDAQSPWTKILGVGAEMATDPLTYAGIGLGGHLGGATAEAAPEIEALLSGRRAAQEALVGQAGERATLQEGLANRLGGLGNQDVSGLASGAQKTYQQAAPDVAQALTDHGLGMAEGQGATVYGTGPAAGTRLSHAGGTGPGTLRGKQLSFAGGPGDMPSVTPYERYLMMSEAAQGGGADALASLHSPTSPQDVLQGVLGTRGQELAQTVPTPSLGQAMGASFMPTDHLAVLQQLGLTSQPVDGVLPQLQSLLADALAAQRAGAGPLSGVDRLGLAAGFGTGVGAGMGYYGSR